MYLKANVYSNNNVIVRASLRMKLGFPLHGPGTAALKSVTERDNPKLNFENGVT